MTRQDVGIMELEEVSLIRQSQKGSCQCTVRLMYEKSEGRFYVWRSMSGEHYIYHVLQGCVHACLPKFYDVTIANGTTTVIEEYIEGQSLGMVRLSAKQFRCVVRELCSVLEYLHGKGIIHRDIKPSNVIFREDGHICLIDFDAARMPKDDLEQDTRLLGTRGYAPPEQYGFSQTDARTDIYSLGVTLGQIMEGQNYRRRYQRVVRKCTNLNPDRRYQTVRGVQRAFFPAKRNICCVLAMLLPICLLWNDFKMLPEKMTGPVAPEVTKMSEPVLTEILYDGAAVYGYLGLQVEDIADMRGEEGTFLYDREESAGTYSYPGMKFEYKCKFILRIQLCKTIRK